MFAAFSICLAHNDTSPLTPKVLSDATYSWSHYVACAFELPACTLTINGVSVVPHTQSTTTPLRTQCRYYSSQMHKSCPLRAALR